MQLQVFKTLWGFDGTPAAAAALALKANFDGFETPAPSDDAALAAFADVLATNGLSYIAEICTESDNDRTRALF